MKSKKGSARTGGQQQDLFSWAASHASLTPQQESGSERRMSATCGRTCCESFESAAPTRLWARMFLESLVGMKEWSSTRCRLTWKMKASKSYRLYFQLAVSTPRTEEIESGLLPTPNTMDAMEPKTDVAWEKEMTVARPGRKKPQNLRDVPNRMPSLIPTPRSAMTGHVSESRLKDKERNLETVVSRAMLSPTPTSSMATTQDFVQAKYAFKNRPEYSDSLLVPTPRASEAKGTGPLGSKSHNHMVERGYLNATMQEATGTSGPLSHQFTLEMMGFPTDWIIAAFSRE